MSDGAAPFWQTDVRCWIPLGELDLDPLDVVVAASLPRMLDATARLGRNRA